jgi:ArsR family transcriptional regulator, arsenate/arsenite/antimonite-responsive transcriptional repressor
MEMNEAIKGLSALAQDGRLAVFRLLVKAGPEGKAAGEIARALGVPANTLSAQLLVLANARLVRARREGRSIFYAVNFAEISDLLVYLMEDCCGGRAEVCAPLEAVASRRRATAKGGRREAVSRSSSRR